MKQPSWMLGRRRLVAVCLGCVMLSACSSSAPARFYTLSGNGVANAAPAASGNTDLPTLAVTAVTIPGTLDRPQMVRFAGGGRVELFEEARWSEPPAHNIARALAEDLGVRLNGAAVAAYPQDASARARYRISVDFSHFDVGTDGSVLLDAIWTIRDTYVAPVQTGGGVPQAVRTTDRLVNGHAHLLLNANGSPTAESSVHIQADALAQLADQLSTAFRQFQAAS